MTVPNRRPPRPHSCSRSRSPLRQCAAAKPSQVIKANSRTKIMSAVQFTSCTACLPVYVSARPSVISKPTPSLRGAQRRSNPASRARELDCFAALAMTSPPSQRALILVLGGEVDDRGQNGADDHPQELIPVEERHADQRRFGSVVEKPTQHGGELNHEQQVPPAPRPPSLPGSFPHRFVPAVMASSLALCRVALK